MTTNYRRLDGTPGGAMYAARVDALLARTCPDCGVMGGTDVPVTTAGLMGSIATEPCYPCRAAILAAWPGLAAEIQRQRDDSARLLAERDRLVAEVVRQRDQLLVALDQRDALTRTNEMLAAEITRLAGLLEQRPETSYRSFKVGSNWEDLKGQQR